MTWDRRPLSWADENSRIWSHGTCGRYPFCCAPAYERGGGWGAERVLICVPRFPPPNEKRADSKLTWRRIGGRRPFHAAPHRSAPSFFSTRLASATVLVEPLPRFHQPSHSSLWLAAIESYFGGNAPQLGFFARNDGVTVRRKPRADSPTIRVKTE